MPRAAAGSRLRSLSSKKQAVDAFLKTLEEPPPHAKFILATTAAHKLSATILSRCQRFDFRSVPLDTVAGALAAIVRREGMESDDDGLLAIAREAGGSLRDATSLLDQVLAFSGGKIDAASVEAARMLLERRWAAGLGYGLGMWAAALAAAAAGLALTQAILAR